MKSTLILNASYEPLGIVQARRAVNLILAEKAVSIDDSLTMCSSTSNAIPIPYVIKMNYFIKKVHATKEVPFSRKGVLVRDNYRCAYCGKRSVEKMTVDHIIPRSRGGKHSWDNCVASCLKCNGYKKDHLLHEIDMKIMTKPTVPSLYSGMLLKAINYPQVFESWSNYVFMYSPDLKRYFVENKFVHKKIEHIFA